MNNGLKYMLYLCFNILYKIIKNAIDKSTMYHMLVNSKNKRLNDKITNGLLTSTGRKQYHLM